LKLNKRIARVVLLAVLAVIMAGTGHAEAAIYPELPVAPTPEYLGSSDETFGLGAHGATITPGWAMARTSALTNQPQAVLWRTNVAPTPAMPAIRGVAWARPATAQTDFLTTRLGRPHPWMPGGPYDQQPTPGVFSPAPQQGIPTPVAPNVGPSQPRPYLASR
jgi:hypothetical protein